jgi:hypothetical protein
MLVPKIESLKIALLLLLLQVIGRKSEWAKSKLVW